MLITLALINHSSRPDAEVFAVTEAINEQVRTDLDVWNVYAAVYFAGRVPPPERTWKVHVWDDAQQALDAGAYGRHEVVGGAPVGHVFVAASTRRRRPWSVAASHEVVEAVLDPQLNTYKYRPSTGELWALEPCDMVDDQSYAIGKVAVSNFVYPAYFDEGAAGPYDRLGNLTKPFELSDRGYADVVQSGGGRTLYGVKPDAAALSRIQRRSAR
jgi:hypothetical protein